MSASPRSVFVSEPPMAWRAGGNVIIIPEETQEGEGWAGVPARWRRRTPACGTDERVGKSRPPRGAHLLLGVALEPPSCVHSRCVGPALFFPFHG